MNVFLAQRESVTYDVDSLLGVYSTMEKAQAACEVEHADEDISDSTIYWEVLTVTVDEPEASPAPVLTLLDDLPKKWQEIQ